jgi:hypothetical protein
MGISESFNILSPKCAFEPVEIILLLYYPLLARINI